VSWQLQEAKQKFSELVRRTLEEGPQVVTKHGEEVVVVVPVEEFRRMSNAGEKKMDYKEF
jgi:prevent-host-death family protein